jgi:hypothetical protein
VLKRIKHIQLDSKHPLSAGVFAGAAVRAGFLFTRTHEDAALAGEPVLAG